MDSFGSAERGSRLSSSYHRQQMRLPAVPQELKKNKNNTYDFETSFLHYRATIFDG